MFVVSNQSFFCIFDHMKEEAGPREPRSRAEQIKAIKKKSRRRKISRPSSTHQFQYVQLSP
jgi:hypothetical protein